MTIRMRNIIVLIIAMVLVFVLFLLFFIVLTNKKIATTKPIPTIAPIPIITPIPTITPPINYNISDQQKLLDIISNRPSLSANDSLIRKKLIDSIGGESGDLLLSSNVTVSYLKSADVFQGEIFTSDIDTAKNDAVQWLLDQGLSKNGICKLPLMFFINSDFVPGFQASEKVLSPLPPGC